MTPRDRSSHRLHGDDASGRLPLIPLAGLAPSPRAERSTLDDLGPRHIVTIDDAPEIRTLLFDLLCGEGYRVSAFAAPPSPCQLAGLAPDLVVLDLLYNGDASGLPFVAALRVHPALRTLPLVVCTGASDAAERAERELAALDVGVVLKPFDIETLLEEIDRRLRRRP